MRSDLFVGAWSILLGIAAYWRAPAIARWQTNHNLSMCEESTNIAIGRFIAVLATLFGVAVMTGVLP